VQKITAKAIDDRELAFILMLRHTGLRIGDASLLRVTQFTDNRIHLYTTKASTPVSVVIPPNLVSLLKALPAPGGYFFLIGESVHPHTASNLWRNRIKRMCKDAKIMPDHPHRFRHSLAADLLSKGASVEDVAAILGNSPSVVQKYYSQWIAARQARRENVEARVGQSEMKKGGVIPSLRFVA
jgi:integrase